MRRRNISKLLPYLMAFVFVNSCTLGVALVAQYEQMEGTSYHAPTELNGDVQSTGLLLIDAVARNVAIRMTLSGVTIARLNEPGKEISTGSFNTGGLLSRNSGIAIIPGLTPGFYNIVKLAARGEHEPSKSERSENLK